MIWDEHFFFNFYELICLLVYFERFAKISKFLEIKIERKQILKNLS